MAPRGATEKKKEKRIKLSGSSSRDAPSSAVGADIRLHRPHLCPATARMGGMKALSRCPLNPCSPASALREHGIFLRLSGGGVGRDQQPQKPWQDLGG